MTKAVLAIDIDVTLNDIGKVWLLYLRTNYKLKSEYRFALPDTLPYNLTELFIPDDYGLNGMEFFSDVNLYDKVSPREDALEYLPILSKQFDIIFVSHIIPTHANSKVEWLNRYFPNHKGIYLTTNTKSHVKCDVFIDDSVKNLNEMVMSNPDTLCLRFRQDYKENVEPVMNFQLVWGWESVFNTLRGGV